MHNFKNTLVVIPARGGSKRIPNKNIKEIFGQPMIFWPLMTLQQIFTKESVLVSTDSKLIKAVVESKGLNVPFMRPEYLSDDFIGTAAVVTHALSWYEKNVRTVDYVLTVYPTAVLLREKDIRISMETLATDSRCDSIMSATSFPFPIQRAVYENKDGYAQMFDPDNYHLRSQDLTEAKHDAGQFYLSRAEAVRRGALLTNSNVRLHLLSRNHVIDVDTFEDFEVAEEKLRLYKKGIDTTDWSF